MTDNEIIKALEKHNDDCSCSLCPYKHYGLNCLHKLTFATTDLINRQKAEIERLEKELELANADKVIAETHEKSAKEMFVDVTQQIKTAKSEAIKEFAERLQNALYSCDVVGNRDNIGYITSDVHSIIDILVKEMTEVNENDRA